MRWCLVLLSVTAFTSMGAARPSRTIVYNATSLLQDPSGNIPLIGGHWAKMSAALPEGGQLVFEDLVPGANWAHPGVFKLVSKEGRVLDEKKVSFPPRQL